MALTNGSYTPQKTVRVIAWPKASVDGTGPEVWEKRYNQNGELVEEVQLRDSNGVPMRESDPPEGFKNFPSYDHTDNYVMVDGRGNIIRQPNGEAIGLKRGQAVVIHPDGTAEILSDERAQYVFAQTHETVTE